MRKEIFVNILMNLIPSVDIEPGAKKMRESQSKAKRVTKISRVYLQWRAAEEGAQLPPTKTLLPAEVNHRWRITKVVQMKGIGIMKRKQMGPKPRKTAAQRTKRKKTKAREQGKKIKRDSSNPKRRLL